MSSVWGSSSDRYKSAPGPAANNPIPVPAYFDRQPHHRSRLSLLARNGYRKLDSEAGDSTSDMKLDLKLREQPIQSCGLGGFERKGLPGAFVILNDCQIGPRRTHYVDSNLVPFRQIPYKDGHPYPKSFCLGGSGYSLIGPVSQPPGAHQPAFSPLLHLTDDGKCWSKRKVGAICC